MRIISGIDLGATGIEYGPLNRPIVERTVLPGIRYVDHKTQEQLQVHYANDPRVDVALIPIIDIVTSGRPITEFVDDESIDFVIASHVMEHVPDFIGWLETNLRILRPGGRIALAFPDRRYCFDLAKQATSLHEVVAAYLEKRTRPNFTQICDHLMNCRKVTPAEVWSGVLDAKNAAPVRGLPNALSHLRNLVEKDVYYDVHCWKLSDSEFVDMLSTIKVHSQLPFDILSLYPTQRNTSEFYAMLVKQ